MTAVLVAGKGSSPVVTATLILPQEQVPLEKSRPLPGGGGACVCVGYIFRLFLLFTNETKMDHHFERKCVFAP